MLQAFRTIIRTEHPRVLFRGIGVVASGAGPAHALYFACYEFAKKTLTTGDRSTVISQGVCVCVCVCVCALFVTRIMQSAHDYLCLFSLMH